MKLFLPIIFFAASAFSSVDSNRYQSLKKKAFSESLEMSERWKALIEMAEIPHQERLTDLKKATKSPTWYIRNASLLALEKINAIQAESEAAKLLFDPALVVRSAAVEVLAKRAKSSEVARQALWKALQDKQNFIQNESLWIRPQIAQHLAQSARNFEKSQFQFLLEDSSAQVQGNARNALLMIEAN